MTLKTKMMMLQCQTQFQIHYQIPAVALETGAKHFGSESVIQLPISFFIRYMVCFVLLWWHFCNWILNIWLLALNIWLFQCCIQGSVGRRRPHCPGLLRLSFRYFSSSPGEEIQVDVLRGAGRINGIFLFFRKKYLLISNMKSIKSSLFRQHG